MLCNKVSVSVKPTAVAVRPSVPSRRLNICCATKQGVSRREAAAVALSFAALVSASPAKAFLGFGNDAADAEKYTKTTSEILSKVKTAIELPKDDPNREELVKSLKTDINNWVATYRRDPKLSGRPSFGNTYSALNALAGHVNSFGPTAPIPKKRLERMMKEIADAENLLARGR